ncbi:MAG TPA: hypothetical protein VNK94_06240, partial [Gaiellaceae bacterium]|nr:hypothetical protein [Gaiellaceae bacterium]
DPPTTGIDLEPDRARCAGGLFSCCVQRRRRNAMANHLTPDELAKETGIDREEVIRICLEEGVPIYHGKIDKTLFQASLEAVGTAGSAGRA